MNLRKHHGPQILTAAGLVMLFSLISCTATAPVSTNRQSSDPSSVVPTVRPMYPLGWEDVTGRSAIPSISLWLVNADRAASITLRTVTVDENALVSLSKEDICTLGHLSLLLKMEEGRNGRRITRAPERTDGVNEYCSYVYEEGGLLRRVVVFRRGKSVHELELLQEAQEQEFQILVADQNSIFYSIVAAPE